MNVIDETRTDRWSLYHSDCIDVLKTIPSASIDFSIFSPPFLQLYVYSNSDRDLGNCATDAQFYEHFSFVIKELFRVVKPGRVVAFHCCNIPAMKERDGYMGLKDFRGDLIRAFQKEGFVFHSEFVIWKDPLIEATRTKALGLLHKQLCKDSTKVRAGIPDYLICMRVPGENSEAVTHPNGLESFAGEAAPGGKKSWFSTLFAGDGDTNISHRRWRRYASPVWMDIRQTNTLNAAAGRSEDDEKHICPLALDVIERGLELYTNPNDIVLSPFAGIGSEGYVSIKMGRRFVGVELKESYYKQAVANLKAAQFSNNLSLFDTPESE